MSPTKMAAGFERVESEKGGRMRPGSLLWRAYDADDIWTSNPEDGQSFLMLKGS